jgi:hypothetical protein
LHLFGYILEYIGIFGINHFLRDPCTESVYQGALKSSRHNNKKNKFIISTYQTTLCKGKGKGKAIPLQAWTVPEDSRKLRLPDFKTICI